MNKKIALTIGDINGIGIELLLKIYMSKKNKEFVLFTNFLLFSNYLKSKKIKIKVNIINKNIKNFEYKKNCLNIYNFFANSNEENTYESIKHCFKLCKKKFFVGMITLPIRKDLLIKKINKKFIGHTELLQELDNKNYSNMLMYYKKLLITPLTTHININSITTTIKKKNYIYKRIQGLNNTLKKDFNIKNPKFLISGINPHAGENGKIGTEEIKIILPEINKIKKSGIYIDGPISADSMLIKNNINKYNCFIFISHDQALIPFKFISNFSGINYTGNLSIIRTSPDHGTAYNLVGKRNVSDKSLLNCFNFIKMINKNRIYYAKTKKITRTKFPKR